MRHLILLTAILAGCLMTGCGGEKRAAEATQPAPAATRIDPATAASIQGAVHFSGKRPGRKPVRMDEEAACKQLHRSPVLAEDVVVNPNGTLSNVFVYIKSGLEGKNFEAPAEPVTIKQGGCMFQPHVLGVRVGQTLVVVNGDPVSHNIHPLPKENQEWNQAQSPQAPNLERQFARPEVMIPIKCNVHSWMRAYVGVTDHPYFAVTGDQGAYTLKGLPPGDYVVGTWHEKYGTQEQKVTVGPSATQTLDFTFKGD